MNSHKNIQVCFDSVIGVNIGALSSFADLVDPCQTVSTEKYNIPVVRIDTVHCLQIFFKYYSILQRCFQISI